MKVQLFDITFDDAEVNPQAVYRSGQMVHIRVRLRLLEPVKCRAVYVKLYGNSRVHWTETRTRGSGNNRRTETVHYTSVEEYLDEKVPIFNPDSQGPYADHHPAGEYIYPVSFQIPATAPSSFESHIGRIRYFVKANIDRPWKFDNYTQKFFTVIRDLDLNTKLPSEVGPFATDDEFDVNCCVCCNCCFGKISVSVALPKRGFVPGEQVHVTGEVRNTSKTDLESINLELYQRTAYRARGKTKYTTRVASAILLPGLQQSGSLTLNHMLPVNPVPSSYIEGCENIHVDYFFRLNADGGCCLSVKKECCELIIGTVALYSAPMALPQMTLQPQPSSSGDAFVPPPPSYEECMFGRVEMDKEDGKSFGGQTEWAPSYPFYAVPPSAPPPR